MPWTGPVQAVEVIDPQGGRQRPWLDPAEGNALLAGTADSPGLYRLVRADTTLAVATVNPDPAESDLRLPDPGWISEAFPRARIHWVGPQNDLAEAVDRAGSGIPLSRWFWAGVVLLMLAEMALAGWRI